MVLPNLLVIGVQKSATTWIHRCLGAHPDIFMAHAKELEFFSRNKEITNLNRYEEHFRGTNKYRYRGESSPGYFWSDRPDAAEVPSRVYRALGAHIRLVLCFRHPVQRAVSAYFHHWRMGRFRGDEPFLEVCKKHGITSTGHYQRHTENWLSVFGEDAFTFLFVDALRADVESETANLFKRLGLPIPKLSSDILRPYHKGFDLIVDGGEITVNTQSVSRNNIKLQEGAHKRMQRDYVVPRIPEGNLRALEELFHDDIMYIEEKIFMRSLGWGGRKDITYYSE